jgi:hypothetical protein
MLTLLRNHRACCPAFLAVVLGSLCCMNSYAGDGPNSAKPQAKARNPKIREVVEMPEDYVGREFTFTVHISTNRVWMKRGKVDFFVFVEDLEGSMLPAGGYAPDSTVNLIRFILPKEEGRRLIEQLSADRKYEARIQFRIERESDVFGKGWRYLGKISSVEVTQSATPR